MTVGRKQYNEADIMTMQREAEARVREMQNRARRTVEEANNTNFQPRNRNWSQNSGMYRGRGGNRQQQNHQHHEREKQEQPEQKAQEHTPPPVMPESKEGAKESTIIGDIMGALGLDEDYLLIIGLMLILINQRADTTLILALAYLLI